VDAAACNTNSYVISIDVVVIPAYNRQIQLIVKKPSAAIGTLSHGQGDHTPLIRANLALIFGGLIMQFVNVLYYIADNGDEESQEKSTELNDHATTSFISNEQNVIIVSGM
jgi:hypothetical protein